MKAEQWEIETAMKRDIITLKNQIWMASNGQPIPGCISVDACRIALIAKGEDGKGFHNT